MYKLKPLKAIHNYFILLTFPFLLFLDCCYFVTGNTEVLLTVIPWNIFFLATHVLVRVFYPFKYEIDREGITAYDRKSLILKLKREQIEKVYIRKEKCNGFFWWLLELLSLFKISPHCTSISFCFSESEVCRQRICSIQRKRLMTSLDFKNELCEFNELFTYRECMKICKILDIEPIFVEQGAPLSPIDGSGGSYGYYQ